MQIENRFSLINEPWIPIADIGRVSLKQIFSELNYRALGGNPVQKIAITKLLLAIAQAACTPKDNEAWKNLGADGLVQNCLPYLEKWHDSFYLYGEKPFLQMPTIATATTQSIGAVLPEIATGNTTILNALQIETELSDADKALLIVQLMGFGLGGKKTDNSIVLSTGYSGKSNDKGKASTGKAGVSLGFMGFLHNFLQGESLLETLWLNLFTQEQIQNLPYANGLGIAPWEAMPKGEQCETAKGLQNSLMGRLLPLSRFCLLNDKGLHYSEGITHLDYKFGMIDPSVAINPATKPAKVLWVDTERRPWRFLTALLSFMEANSGGFECPYIRHGLLRARTVVPQFGLWSGGLRVSSNAGEQYVSGSDDFVESLIFFDNVDLGKPWYNALKLEMQALDDLADTVKKSTWFYFKSQNVDGKNKSTAAEHLFWQLCERKFQDLLNACPPEEEKNRALLRKDFAQFANNAYNTYCPNDTARQLTAWVENSPRLGYYLKDVNKKDKEDA